MKRITLERHELADGGTKDLFSVTMASRSDDGVSISLQESFTERRMAELAKGVDLLVHDIANKVEYEDTNHPVLFATRCDPPAPLTLPDPERAYKPDGSVPSLMTRLRDGIATVNEIRALVLMLNELHDSEKANDCYGCTDEGTCSRCHLLQRIDELARGCGEAVTSG